MSTGIISSPGQKRSTRLQENGRHSKPSKPIELSGSGQLDTRNSCPPLSRRNHQKPRRSRKMAGMEEVVKNMSSVPCYLQRLVKEDTLQKKALNFGVLDWGSLEKWTYLQKQAANRGVGDSLRSSNASSSVPTRKNDSRLAQKDQNCRRRLRFPDSGAERAKMSGAHSHENGKGVSDVGCSSTFKGYNESPPTCDMTKIQIDKSRESGQQIFSDSLRRAEKSLQEQCARIEGVWDHLQETVHKGRISCDFADVSKEMPGEVDRNSFLFANPSSHVSHSCPFPSKSPSGKYEVATTNTKCKHGMHDVVADSSSGPSAVKVAHRQCQNEVKVPTSLRKELSPHRLLRAGINRIISYRAGINRIISYSAQEGSSGHQSKQTRRSALEEEDEVAARGRRSPFKRMLNPLLKSKHRSQFSGPIATSCDQETRDIISNSNKLPIRYEVEPVKGRCKSSDSTSNPSTSQVIDSVSPVQDEKNAVSMKQALLKLAWKNGLPLFIFSTNDDNILAATMGKRSITEKNDSECIYTLFTAHEIKKKCGSIGKGQGNKLKKQGLVYNVVGQMKVSSSKFSTEREFVLFGGHLVPTGLPVKSLLKSELAAIVVKFPGRSNALQSTNCWELPPQMNSSEKNFSSIVAVLPSGAHGLSAVGEPSSLIERWRCGGYCDCGGWDEGCMLTVLTDKAGDRSSSGAVQIPESRCVELFNQGSRAKERVFTMVALKEGVYNVEIGPSIALLQAFAICIATLHSSMPTILAKLHCSDATLADYTRMAARKS